MNIAHKINEFISKRPEWKNELNLLRKLTLNCELEETFKWQFPTYTWEGKNIVGLGAFKEYVGLWFFQGVFLEDKHNKLINAQEGKTQAMRQWRFQSINEMDEQLIVQYIKEAIQNQKEGKELKPNKGKPLEIPEILEEKLNGDPQLKDSFGKFTPGKQREFTEHIQEAKRKETKLKRIEKVVGMIKDGIGLNDKYR